MWLPELGVYYYKARMYSPTIGRFMQTDPIGYADGMNMYAYVGNDPVNGVDPTGMRSEAECEQQTGDICAGGDRPRDLNWWYVLWLLVDGVGGGGDRPGESTEGAEIVVRAKPTKPQLPQNNSKACQQLRKDSEGTQSVLPSYVTGNKNWNDASTLQGYRNLYQDSFEQYDAVSGPIASTLITAATTAFSFTPWGKGAKMAVGTAAATQGASLSLSALKDSTEAKVEALDARIKVLGAGCE